MAVAHGLGCSEACGSAQSRDRTHVSIACIGRQFFTTEPQRKPRNDSISKGYILRYWVLELHIFWGDTSEPTAITKFSFSKVLWVKDVYSLWQDASCPPTIVLRFYREGWSLQSSPHIWHCFQLPLLLMWLCHELSPMTCRLDLVCQFKVGFPFIIFSWKLIFW